MDSNRWFAVTTQVRREHIAAELLANKGYDCFLPTYGDSRTKDRTATRETPLFPGYLFCRITSTPSARLITTPAVLGIVTFAGKTAFVSDKEIADLKLVVESGLPRQPLTYLPQGKQVRVHRGPLAGAEGVVETARADGRFIVRMSLLQRAVAVELDADMLEPATAISPYN